MYFNMFLLYYISANHFGSHFDGTNSAKTIFLNIQYNEQARINSNDVN